MSGIRFDPDSIRALAGILTETGLTEIEIAEKDSRIRVVRAPPPAGSGVTIGPTQGAPPELTEVASTALEAPDLSNHPGAVLSPMVGIVYLSPEPGAPPFVALGQDVAAGQVLLLIEAMKTFNQIKAPKEGTVMRILVASGSPVEYGEPLLILD